MKSVRTTLYILASLIIVSCAVKRPYQVQDVAPGKLYRDIDTTDTATIASISWKDMFTDPLLQSLIQEAINNNNDLKIAQARTREAEATFAQSRAALFPYLSAFAGVNQIRISPLTYNLALSSGWEIDLWRKIRGAKRAAKILLLQSEAYQRAVQTQLVADVANYYYTLLALDSELRLTQQTIALRDTDVITMRQLKESNVVTGAAVVQSLANRYSAEVTLPDLKQSIRETENSLRILMGLPPDSIPRSSLEVQKINLNLKTGIPAQLLSYRPDVQQAELQLRYNAELVHVAKTYFYPSLTINAEAGYSSTVLSTLFNSAPVFLNLAGGLTQPLFNQGLNRQRLRVAQGRQDEALYAFKQSLLTAGMEVSNALYSYQSAIDKINIRAQQITNLQKAVDYTKELLKYTSATNYTDVLTSEELLLTAQLNSIRDRQQQFQAIIALYRSLGGGWK